jgi:hypothetical protein
MDRAHTAALSALVEALAATPLDGSPLRGLGTTRTISSKCSLVRRLPSVWTVLGLINTGVGSRESTRLISYAYALFEGKRRSW